MPEDDTKMVSEAAGAALAPMADGTEAPMMAAMNFADIGTSPSALIEAVLRTNLLAMQELLHAKDPEAVLDLQRRFAREYLATLMRGTSALVNAITATAIS